MGAQRAYWQALPLVALVRNTRSLTRHRCIVRTDDARLEVTRIARVVGKKQLTFRLPDWSAFLDAAAVESRTGCRSLAKLQVAVDKKRVSNAHQKLPAASTGPVVAAPRSDVLHTEERREQNIADSDSLARSSHERRGTRDSDNPGSLPQERRGVPGHPAYLSHERRGSPNSFQVGPPSSNRQETPDFDPNVRSSHERRGTPPNPEAMPRLLNVRGGSPGFDFRGRSTQEALRRRRMQVADASACLPEAPMRPMTSRDRDADRMEGHVILSSPVEETASSNDSARARGLFTDLLGHSQSRDPFDRPEFGEDDDSRESFGSLPDYNAGQDDRKSHRSTFDG
eukprot:TRINITY_DN64565_c0_g1_i1.p1 TRINITY_DN64565_c0_g1~~TRINITY_DN64565_c0_g1_i1.p1  ORF type:complete len:340 (+),score=30.87 TRINITY_DN64565_c0_g1_i1:107-1126(+)